MEAGELELHYQPIVRLRSERIAGVEAPLRDRDPEGRAVVYAIISLADALGVRVTGEGIEPPTQLEMLTEMGCQYGQGNLLGTAVPADELAEMLKARNVHPAASKGPQS